MTEHVKHFPELRFTVVATPDEYKADFRIYNDCEYGSNNPGRQTCSTCYSYRDGTCHRLETEVEGWWNGCMLHCGKKLVRRTAKS